MRLLKIVRVLAEIVDQPDGKRSEQRIEEWNQEILNQISIKYSKHSLFNFDVLCFATSVLPGRAANPAAILEILRRPRKPQHDHQRHLRRSVALSMVVRSPF